MKTDPQEIAIFFYRHGSDPYAEISDQFVKGQDKSKNIGMTCPLYKVATGNQF